MLLGIPQSVNIAKFETNTDMFKCWKWLHASLMELLVVSIKCHDALEVLIFIRTVGKHSLLYARAVRLLHTCNLHSALAWGNTIARMHRLHSTISYEMRLPGKCHDSPTEWNIVTLTSKSRVLALTPQIVSIGTRIVGWASREILVKINQGPYTCKSFHCFWYDTCGCSIKLK